MALARFQATAVDSAGNVIPNATIQVRREAPGLPLALLYEDEDELIPKGNPFTADSEGQFAFHARGFLNGYRVRAFKAGVGERVWFNVRIGTAGGVDTDQLGIGADTDRQVDTLADRDAYDSEAEGYRVLVSDIGDGRAAIYSRVTATPGVWTDPAIITGAVGPAGTGLAVDVTVDDLAERALYDGEAEGFFVLVADVGDGRAAIYSMGPGGSGDWSDPAYITAAVSVGSTTTVGPDDPANVTQGGTPVNRILNFEIPRGRSAYEVAVAEGFVGDETAWLNSLKGVTAGLRFLFDNPTADADPGAGNFRLNHATGSSATQLFVDDTDSDGADVSSFVDSWGTGGSTIKGRLTIRSAAVPATYALFNVTAVTAGTGYRKVTIAYVTGSGAFADGEPVGIEFARTGDSISGITMGQAIVATLIFGV